MYNQFRNLLLFCLSFFIFSCEENNKEYDLVIYGGTSAGVVAAVQAARMNKSVIIIEPGTEQQLGGLTSGGLGRTDFGNKNVIGGIALEFYREINNYYKNPDNWKWENRLEYFENQTYHPGATDKDEEGMWFFEPSAARKIFQDWIDLYNIPVVYGDRIIREGEGRTEMTLDGNRVAFPNKISKGVVKKNGRIEEIVMESGTRYIGKYFMDATYEGDLMAGAGISFTIGREGIDIYNETLNGIRASSSIPSEGTPNYRHHQFEAEIDPYIIPGDSSSGILPMVNNNGAGLEGSSDHRIQAYCFRMCLTDNPENRIPFHKPADYKEINYELLFRNYEAGFSRLPWINSPMPNRKTDTNNQSAFSTDFIGANYTYPEGSYEERERIINEHLNYQQGLMWTLANHPRIPKDIRESVSKWGMAKDEFVEGSGWQNQIYVREARRMISDNVMTQHHCQGEIIANESIGMGAYGMDSHHTQRYIDQNGFVKNEGDIQKGLSKPYPISYRSITPKKEECQNLVVPVCLSASHIAFGSIRMEPVFMVLGQSAAVAACLAIDQESAVQDIDYSNLNKILRDMGQILELTDVKKTN